MKITLIENVITRLSFSTNRDNLYIGRKALLLILGLVIFSCSKNPETYIQHIEGYWEIDEVIMADGSKKEYKFNETVDYISLNDSLKGFRKKLKPGINDTYFTSDDAEALELKTEDNILNIYYSTRYANWKETVLEASINQLRIITDSETIYVYKRYTPIQLDVE